ncbi:hypothetical protein Hanom_Chr02g00143251 [Helianthus anomalus]
MLQEDSVQIMVSVRLAVNWVRNWFKWICFGFRVRVKEVNGSIQFLFGSTRSNRVDTGQQQSTPGQLTRPGNIKST